MSVKYEDIKEYTDELKKKGFDDEEKLKAMFKKAKKIAQEDDNKKDNKEDIIGIMQGFFQENKILKDINNLIYNADT